MENKPANNWESEYLKNLAKKSEPAGQVSVPSKKPKLSWPLIALIVFLICFAAFIGFAASIFSRFLLLEAMITMMPGEQLVTETNILVLGLDSGRAIHRSDTIMVAHVIPDEMRVEIVSIPRDTLVDIPGRGKDKINHAFAYGGIDLSRRTVENFLNLEIPYYITIDMNGLASLIDEVGGVNINVESRMYYVDYSQNLFVDLYPGLQNLKGPQAMAYLRYRSDGGDFKRIMRQQGFIKAIGDQMAKKENLVKAPHLILRLLSFMQTNLNTRQIFGLAFGMKRICELGTIDMTMLDGSDLKMDGVYYLQPDIEKVQKIVDARLRIKKKIVPDAR